jgi:O-antigen/teichoic acid export membrane protein
MGLEEALKYWVIGVISLIVLFSIMVVVVPMVSEAGADSGSMAMIGLISFVTAGSFLTKGTIEMMKGSKGYHGQG